MNHKTRGYEGGVVFFWGKNRKKHLLGRNGCQKPYPMWITQQWIVILKLINCMQPHKQQTAKQGKQSRSWQILPRNTQQPQKTKTRVLISTHNRTVSWQGAQEPLGQVFLFNSPASYQFSYFLTASFLFPHSSQWFPVPRLSFTIHVYTVWHCIHSIIKTMSRNGASGGESRK